MYFAFFFSPLCATCPTYLILLHLITLISAEEYNHKAPHYALFYIPLLLPDFKAQIFSSASSSHIPSGYVLSFM